MGMTTPAESSPTEAHLNDLATRIILEDSGGFMYVMARQTQLQSQTRRADACLWCTEWLKIQNLRHSRSPRG